LRNRFGVKIKSNEGIAIELASRPVGVSSAELVTAIRQTSSPVFERAEAEGHLVTYEGFGQARHVWVKHKDDVRHTLVEPPSVLPTVDSQELVTPGPLRNYDLRAHRGTNTGSSTVFEGGIPTTASKEAKGDISPADSAKGPSNAASNTRSLLLIDVANYYGCSPRLMTALENTGSNQNTATIDWFLSSSNSLQFLNGPYFSARLILELEEAVNRALRDGLDPNRVLSPTSSPEPSRLSTLERGVDQCPVEEEGTLDPVSLEIGSPLSPGTRIEDREERGDLSRVKQLNVPILEVNEDLQNIPAFLRRDNPQNMQRSPIVNSDDHKGKIEHDTGTSQLGSKTGPPKVFEGGDNQRRLLSEEVDTAAAVGSKTGDSDVRSIQLKSIVEQYDVSVRLHNVIVSAAGNNSLPVVSIGGYLDLGHEAYERFIDLPNCGKQTADELDAIVQRLCESYGYNSALVGGRADHRGIRDFRLIDVINQHNVSNRLRHAISEAYDEGYLPYLTVGGYLDAGASGRALLAGLPRVGRTTINEFDVLIQSLAKKSNNINDEAVTGTEIGRFGTVTRDKLLAVFSQLPFPDVVLHIDTSVRLKNALEHAKFLPSSFDEYLTNHIKFDVELKALPNVGENSIQELRAITEQILSLGLQVIGVPTV